MLEKWTTLVWAEAGAVIDRIVATSSGVQRFISCRIASHGVMSLSSLGIVLNRWLPTRYGVDGGWTRRFVACSNAYASSRRRGSLQAMPAKLTPKGAGLAAKPSGNAGVGAFRTIPNGTITVG